MGVGRLEFLRLMGLALAGLAIDPLKAVVTNDNIYVNKRFGIIFHKPEEWSYIHVSDFGRLMDGQILPEWIEEDKNEIWQELGSPICISTKYPIDDPRYKGVFSPTITLQVTPKSEMEALGFHSFEEILDQSAEGTTYLLKDFRVLKRYEPQTINGSVLHEFDTEYTFEHEELEVPLKVELKALKAEHNGCYYDFNCHQSRMQNQIAEREFEEFKKSIQLI